MRLRDSVMPLLGALALAGAAPAAVEIATIDTPGNVAGLVLDGTIGYAADTVGGIRILDLSIPTAPVEIASLPPIALGNVAAVALDGDRLYAAEGVGGISIIDVSNPASPVRLGSLAGLHPTSDIAASGDYAYVISIVGPTGFYVVDVSNPALPVLIASLDAPGPTLSWLTPTRLAAGSRVIDVSDPLDPEVVEDVVPFAGTAGEGFGVTPAIARYDLADLENPAFVNQWLLPTNEGSYADVGISAELAWAPGPASGLALFDVSDAEPSHPLLTSIDLAAFTTVRRLQLVGTTLYMGAVGSSGRGLYVFDASDPAALVQLGFLAGDVWDLDVASGFAFYVDPSAASEPTGLYAVDVSNPAAMSVVGFVPIPYVDMVRVSGNRAYVMDNHGVQDVLLAFDVSNPAAPVQIESKGSLGVVGSIATSGNLVLLTTSGGLNGRLRVFDATTASAITQIGEYVLEGQPNGLAVAGSRAYLGGAIVDVVDFTFPFSPTRVTSFDLPSTSFTDPAPAGSRLYVNATGGYVLTLDLADAAVPRLIGASVLTTRNNALTGGEAVATGGALFFGSDSAQRRLRVFDTTQPAGLGPRRLAVFPSITGAKIELDAARDIAFVLDSVVRIVDIAADRQQYECANGLDDDGDTLVDHALDPGCRDGHDVSEEPDCSDGVDDDGDGLVDYPADPSCASAAEASEAPSCDDGSDDDGDGFVDFGADPGCSGWLSEIENAKCQNGLDDDGDTRIDFDGGASVNGGIPLGSADANCPSGSRDKESPNTCGLGAELALGLLVPRARTRGYAGSSR